MRGKVFFTGAGPGDPELLTLKAVKAIQAADVILYDSLVNETILDLAPRVALRIDVGKRCGKHSVSQREINLLLIEHAPGNIVVRLKGGDPMIFGRITEELQALDAACIAYEIIPGITAASAAAASLGLSLTKRNIARSVHFLTGHGAEENLPAHDWAALTRAGGTIVIYMGRETLLGLAAHLIEAGMPPSMPAIAVENASLPSERITHATISTLPGKLHGIGPTLILLGEAMESEDVVLSMKAFS
jgi:uroporphyrin-III C-methyltransferase